MNQDPRLTATNREPEVAEKTPTDFRREIFAVLDQRLDLAEFIKIHRPEFTESPDSFRVIKNISLNGTAYEVVLSSESEVRFQPVVELRSLNEGGALETNLTYHLTGFFKKRIAAIINGESEVETDPKVSAVEIPVYRSVPDFMGLERVLYVENPSVLYLVPNKGKGARIIYKVEPNPMRGHKAFSFNLSTKRWAATGQSLSTLTEVGAEGFSFLDRETLSTLSRPDGPKRVKPVLGGGADEPEKAEAAETEVLEPAALAALFSAPENQENWLWVFQAITSGSNSWNLESKGVQMVVKTEGKKEVFTFEVTGEDATLWHQMKAEKARALQDEGIKKHLIRFLKAHNAKGFGFKAPAPKAEKLVADPPPTAAVEEPPMSRAEMMAAMGGILGESEAPEPVTEKNENREAEALEAFIDRFNQEVLQQIKGQISRADRSESTVALMEKFLLAPEDLAVDMDDGLVVIDFSDNGIEKARFWLQGGHGKTESVRQKWYIYRTNLEAVLKEIGAGKVEIDYTNFQSVLDEEDERIGPPRR